MTAGPWGSPPPLPPAFLPGASSRGTPASRQPPAPSAQPDALAPLARSRCLLKVTRRRGGAQGGTRPRRRPPQRPTRRARPAGLPAAATAIPALNQRGEAPLPPPGSPGSPGRDWPRGRPPPPGPQLQLRRHWLRVSASLYISPGALEWSCIKRASERRRGGRLQASPGPGLGAGRQRRRRQRRQRAPALRRPQAVGLREPEDGSERRRRREYPLRCPSPTQAEKVSPALCAPPRSARRAGGGAARGESGKTETAKAAAAWLPTCQEAQDSTGAQSLPRAGVEAGAGPEVEERWERRCGGDSPHSCREGVGGVLEVSCLGRGHRGWEGAEQVRRDVPGVVGSHPANQAQLRAWEATGLGRVPRLPRWGGALGEASSSSPGKPSSRAQRWVAESSGSQPSARRSCRLPLLDRGVVRLLSAYLRQASFRHSRGTRDPPQPSGDTWRL